MTPLEVAKDMLWGTYGKGVAEAHMQDEIDLPEVRWVRLGDCSTNHLKAILRNIEPILSTQPRYLVSYLAASIVLDSRKGTLCARLLAIFSNQ